MVRLRSETGAAGQVVADALDDATARCVNWRIAVIGR